VYKLYKIEFKNNNFKKVLLKSAIFVVFKSKWDYLK